MLLTQDYVIVPRPKTGNPPKKFHRRWVKWSSEMTTLVNDAARIVAAKELYFSHRTEWAGKVNIAGIAQGVMISVAKHLDEITSDQWETFLLKVNKFKVEGEKEIHLDPQALTAFHAIGKQLETVKLPPDMKLFSRGEYRYPLIIAVALLWFTEHHQ